MDSMILIGLFALALIIVGGVGATLLAKRNDEMLHGKQSHRHH